MSGDGMVHTAVVVLTLQGRDAQELLSFVRLVLSLSFLRLCCHPKTGCKH